MTPDLTAYDVILINSSAGKDSQAMIDVVADLAMTAGVRNRIVVVHCDLGRAEWPGTRELAETQAGHYGLRFEVVRRKKHDLLAEIQARGKWPSSTTRYCTSYYKREPALSLMTRLTCERGKPGQPVRILNCSGFRADESPARAKREVYSLNRRATNGRRIVYDWLPIHLWSVSQVWDRIRRSQVPYHPACDKGMPRLSCRFCIFAPKAALMIAARENPELFEEYLAIEKKIGHRFRKELSLEDVKEALDRGEDAGPVTDTWNM
jgi:3'-phosphoadenosine 5'-phosphosulfate sulfotransferase (PAPS reductase)/FAD synthetase